MKKMLAVPWNSIRLLQQKPSINSLVSRSKSWKQLPWRRSTGSRNVIAPDKLAARPKHDSKVHFCLVTLLRRSTTRVVDSRLHISLARQGGISAGKIMHKRSKGVHRGVYSRP